MAFHSSSHSDSPSHSNSHGNSPTIIQNFKDSAPSIIQGASFRTQFPANCSEKTSMRVLASAANDVRRSLKSPTIASDIDLTNIPDKWDTAFVKDIYNHTNGTSYSRYNRGTMQMNMKLGDTHANSYTDGNNGRGAQDLVQDTGHIKSDGTFWNDQEHPITKSAYSSHANGHKRDLKLDTTNLIAQKSSTLSDNLTDAEATFANKQAILDKINKKLLKAAAMPLEEEKYIGHANHSNHSSHSSSHSSCSRKFKQNIKNFELSGLDILKDVNIVSFNYNDKVPCKEDTSITHYGFIAEDTSQILSTKYQDRMDYTSCIGILIKAVQELNQKIDRLENKEGQSK